MNLKQVGAADRGEYRQAAGASSTNARLVRIAPLNPKCRMRSRWRLVLRIRLTITAEASRGGHALLEGCETAICPAVVVAAVNRTPRIVLSFAWSDKHSCCSDYTEREDKSHQSPPNAGLLLNDKISRPVGTLIWIKELSLSSAASRRLVR
jgi:hypothetical protein